ncbi:uncharacterized protein LOC8274507 [Ricinus communis]|uniref:OVATE domain-containing protein n=1 Tax=Ricinus communis TaxID=3988 RepID=B9RQN6_RICCO|nr:uncharacterized protein LOC8274507 [Ricinus communis]EEF46475.1 hypothetical protein RCOM_1494490 [Ricinus communis]|eukprot:XP_002516055.1 uncharacterized protein LOC8274507 [Ricinus communis]
MQLKDSIEKTKVFFHNTLQHLKSLFFEGYQKLPKPDSFNPFSCANCSIKNHQRDEYYTNFCNEWECDLEKAMKRKESSSITVSKEAAREEVQEKEDCKANSTKLPESPLKKKEEVTKEERSKKSSHSRKVEEELSKKEKEGAYALAKKMKELEMMDVSDVEHVLDVEEALHYYNRLRSPVYVDIVDQFFTDMYREFSVPQASASINSSKRRLGSKRL